jgi:hypothetical protein
MTRRNGLRWHRTRIGDEDISILPLSLGLQREIGVIVAGSQGADFPQQTERLVLSVAANQAAIGLQEGTAPERTEASRQRTRAAGRATNCRPREGLAVAFGPATIGEAFADSKSETPKEDSMSESSEYLSAKDDPRNNNS